MVTEKKHFLIIKNNLENLARVTLRLQKKAVVGVFGLSKLKMFSKRNNNCLFGRKLNLNLRVNLVWCCFNLSFKY